MLEQQIQGGDYLYGFDFPSAAAGGAPGMSNQDITDATIYRQRTTTRRSGFMWHKKTTTTTVQELSFRWLPWVDGKINYCEQQGLDVLSGWFSGCWMARYAEGSNRVCHVALQDNDNDCTAAWNAKKATLAAGNISEFRPHTSVRKGSVKLGLVTSTGQLYAIGLDATKLDVPNPWTKASDWLKRFEMFTPVLAEEYAAKEVIPVSNIHPAGAWQVRDVKGPLRAQNFPD